MASTAQNPISHAIKYGAGHFHSDPTIADLEHQVEALVKRVELQEKHAANLSRFVIDEGSWSTSNVRSWQQPQEKTSGRVNFSQKFNQVPKVTVSLRSLDTNKDYNTRVKLYSAGVSWVAIGQ
ncbi:hypothetical protein V2G26_012926 [Clonostachys chloroleuca]